jgi:hypothetical protein
LIPIATTGIVVGAGGGGVVGGVVGTVGATVATVGGTVGGSGVAGAWVAGASVAGAFAGGGVVIATAVGSPFGSIAGIDFAPRTKTGMRSRLVLPAPFANTSTNPFCFDESGCEVTVNVTPDGDSSDFDTATFFKRVDVANDIGIDDPFDCFTLMRTEADCPAITDTFRAEGIREKEVVRLAA